MVVPPPVVSSGGVERPMPMWDFHWDFHWVPSYTMGLWWRVGGGSFWRRICTKEKEVILLLLLHVVAGVLLKNEVMRFQHQVRKRR